MAMTRRSWYRMSGAVVVLVVVVVGGTILLAQNAPPPPPPTPSGHSQEEDYRCARANHTEQMLKPLGTWERKIGPLAVTLRFDNDQLHGTIVIKTKDAGVKGGIVTFRTDYNVTKDSILYGVVSTVEAQVSGKKKLDGEDLVKLTEGTSALQDQPFSVRYRVDGDELILRDLKFHAEGFHDKSNKALAIGLGRFTRKAEDSTTTASFKKK